MIQVLGEVSKKDCGAEKINGHVDIAIFFGKLYMTIMILQEKVIFSHFSPNTMALNNKSIFASI